VPYSQHIFIFNYALVLYNETFNLKVDFFNIEKAHQDHREIVMMLL